MKIILFLSILFCVIALPALGELTDTDLNRIRLIINEELKPIKADIVSLKTDVAWMRGKLENVDKQITHGTNITYGLIALIVAAVAIPQILIALRSGRDRALERQIEMLT
ncbi:hypothetical protein J4G08_06105 [Candidatus Poribacteria bacterium]|nr:hypothetical protein [Candidatus Poribacteria bacterium]